MDGIELVSIRLKAERYSIKLSGFVFVVTFITSN